MLMLINTDVKCVRFELLRDTFECISGFYFDIFFYGFHTTTSPSLSPSSCVCLSVLKKKFSIFVTIVLFFTSFICRELVSNFHKSHSLEILYIARLESNTSMFVFIILLSSVIEYLCATK